LAEEIVLTKYKIKCLDAEIPVKIVRKRKEVIVNYFLELPKLGLGTKALMEKIKENIIAALPVGIERIIDIHYFEKVKRKKNCFFNKRSPGKRGIKNFGT